MITNGKEIYRVVENWSNNFREDWQIIIIFSIKPFQKSDEVGLTIVEI